MGAAGYGDQPAACDVPADARPGYGGGRRPHTRLRRAPGGGGRLPEANGGFLGSVH